MGKSMKLGGGGRFAALKGKLAKEPGVTDPAGLAASIGRKKFGAPKMAAMATKGKANAADRADPLSTSTPSATDKALKQAMGSM